MKFTEGQWLIKSEYNTLRLATVFDSQFDGSKYSLYVSSKPIETRANTIDQGSLTFEIEAPIPEVFKIRIYHHKGTSDSKVHFTLNTEEKGLLECLPGEHVDVLKNGKAEIHINKDDVDLSFYYDGQYLTGSKSNYSYYHVNRENTPFMVHQLGLTVGESIYGLGERFTPFVKNGQVVDMWNEDGGTSSQISYKNIPFYLSSRKYGIFVNEPGLVSFEVGSENVQRVQFSKEGESLEYYYMPGKDLKAVLSRYTSLTGKPPVPPFWSFGLWLSTSFTTNYDEATVMGYIDRMEKENIPLSVFHFDCYWMQEFQWTDFIWDKRTFPDPKGMLGRIRDRGIHTCVWINPYIAQKSRLFDEAAQLGYLLKKPKGDVWQWDRWQAGMGIVDFTNPKAVEWYQKYLGELIDMGVDTFKTDFGERIPTDVEYFNGADPQLMHNYYPYLYNKAVYDLIVSKKGAEEAMVFARSATVGGQSFPVHWGGDCWATYESMSESLRGGLSLCLSGFGYWSHDIGGFEETATPDLYKRWCAFGMLSSHSRLHGSTSVRVPWAFDEEACRVLSFFTHLKLALMPYLYGQAWNTSLHGHPMMRAMVLEYPDDPLCHNLDRQYFLGENLLVAPIFNAEGKGSVYLPQGRWTNYLTGEVVEGPVYRQEVHDYFSLPLYVRENSIIPTFSSDDTTEYDPNEAITWNVYELETEGEAHIRSTAGESLLSLSVKKEGSTLVVSSPGSLKKGDILLHNIKSVHNKDLDTELTPKGLLIKNALEIKDFTIKL
ncbi:alpha-xylosidase [Spirochaeta cellobiosiphila]|uniref:alpha-xylosidase n=1 Tax=Spirochaeta cellobiosiphila TaxID=504483 RepID=UPI000413EAAB|nr:alpha-xylosidase [Spirochaeta cellobiosiphila]